MEWMAAGVQFTAWRLVGIAREWIHADSTGFVERAYAQR
jgi:hypothetical protein